MMRKKFKELILYLVSKSEDDYSFGATKLNKLLFLIDFQAYAFWGKSVTGAKYVRLHYGPVPQQLPSVRDDLVKEGKLSIERRDRFGKPQVFMHTLKNPDLSLFSKDELDLVDEVLKDCVSINGTELSNWSHTLRPWLDAEDGEEIPLYTVFILKDVPVSRSDIAWGQERLEQLRATGNAI